MIFNKVSNALKQVKTSWNMRSNIQKYNSAANLRPIYTSETRLGNLTDRNAGFRPITGQGFNSDSTKGSEFTNQKLSRNSNKSSRITNMTQNFKFRNLFGRPKPEKSLPKIVDIDKE